MLQRDFNLSGNNPLYHLSLSMTIDQLNYAIFDNKGILLKHKTYSNISFNAADTLELIKSNPDLHDKYDKITVTALTCNTHQLSFKDEQIAKIIPNLEFKNVRVEKLPGCMVYNYYGLTPAQTGILNTIFNNENYQVHNFVFALSTYFIGLQQPLLHIHLEQKLASIYIQKNGSLQFFNSYGYKTANDILYFVLAACKLNDINLQNDQKTISGWIEKDSEIYNVLNRYLGNLDVLRDDAFLIEEKSKHQPHYYFAHYIGKSCAL
ncbi:MAG: DUF3822 family protein [Chitinophagales bacterium]|nr:DUF3822 family protein [Chitinophagales bacterium]